MDSIPRRRPDLDGGFASILIRSTTRFNCALASLRPNPPKSRPLAALGMMVVIAMTPGWAAEATGSPAKTTQRAAPLQVVSPETSPVTVTAEGERAVITIQDGRGIGRTTLRRNLEHWPATVVVRAYLRGLESLTISAGAVKLSASVLSHSGHPTVAHLWREGQEGPPLKPKSPYWLDIRRLDTKGQPVNSLPPKGGCFELTIPQKLLDQAATFELNWIDFYR
jgi:hypothetical protein